MAPGFWFRIGLAAGCKRSSDQSRASARWLCARHVESTRCTRA